MAKKRGTLDLSGLNQATSDTDDSLAVVETAADVVVQKTPTSKPATGKSAPADKAPVEEPDDALGRSRKRKRPQVSFGVPVEVRNWVHSQAKKERQTHWGFVRSLLRQNVDDLAQIIADDQDDLDGLLPDADDPFGPDPAEVAEQREPLVQLYVQMPPAHKQALKELAADHGLKDVSPMVRAVLVKEFHSRSSRKRKK